MELNPFAKKIVLSGDIAYIRIVLNIESQEREREAWNIMIDSMPEIRQEVENIVHRHLGTEITVRGITPIRGSIEVMVAIGATYYAISSYHDFMESIELVRAQIHRYFGSVMDRFNPRVTSSAILGPGATSIAIPSDRINDPTKMLLLIYMIASHAALLILFIWMIYKRLGTP